MSRCRPLLPLITLLLATTAPAASSDCTRNWICINSKQVDGNVELHAENLSEVPLTFTLKVRTRGLRADVPKTVTETLPPGQSRRVMKLSRIDRNKQGRYQFSYQWTIGNKDATHDDSYLYRLPYANGRSYRVIQGFGSRFSHTGHEYYAVDFKMDEGTPIHAARGGVVARKIEANSIGCWEDGCGRYANYVVILHDDQTTGEYYHLLKDGVLVEVGERVEAGQKIGLSGNTGHSTMPHLHFGVYRAAERGREQSIPVRFASADGIIERPRRGGRYQAVPMRRASTSAGNPATFEE